MDVALCIFCFCVGVVFMGAFALIVLKSETVYIHDKPNTLRLDIDKCPRCNCHHPDIAFIPMASQKRGMYWGACPQLGQPIILRMKRGGK